MRVMFKDHPYKTLLTSLIGFSLEFIIIIADSIVFAGLFYVIKTVSTYYCTAAV